MNSNVLLQRGLLRKLFIAVFAFETALMLLENVLIQPFFFVELHVTMFTL